MKKLELFYKSSCPFCIKVLAFIEEKEIEVELLDVTSSKEISNRLIQEGGKRQVPCLMIDGKPLYESDAIIEWLSQPSSSL